MRLNKNKKGVFAITLLVIIILAIILFVGFVKVLIGNSEAFGGYFKTGKFIITRVEGETLNTMSNTIHHEIGHFVWDECLTRSQKKEYEKLWEDVKDFKKNDFADPKFRDKETGFVCQTEDENDVEEDFARVLGEWGTDGVCEQQSQFIAEIDRSCEA